MAERLGLPVVCDLRSRDVAAGGQGAPLVSDVRPAAAGWPSGPEPGSTAAVNLGGIANLTVVDGGQVLTAYDIGPAGALMDPAASWASGGTERFDPGGALAARGTVSEPLLARLKAEPYYRLPPPRSTGRELFNAGYLRAALAGTDLAGQDVAATVTRLLVDLLAAAVKQLWPGASSCCPAAAARTRPHCAGCARRFPACAWSPRTNSACPRRPRKPWRSRCCGFLTWNGLPGSVTAATGAAHQAILGTIQPGATPLRLPEPAAAPPRHLRPALARLR